MTKTNKFREHLQRAILVTCDIGDTDYNFDSSELEFMTIFVAWQSRVTLDSIRNSCDVFIQRMASDLGINLPEEGDESLPHHQPWWKYIYQAKILLHDFMFFFSEQRNLRIVWVVWGALMPQNSSKPEWKCKKLTRKIHMNQTLQEGG